MGAVLGCDQATETSTTTVGADTVMKAQEVIERMDDHVRAMDKFLLAPPSTLTTIVLKEQAGKVAPDYMELQEMSVRDRNKGKPIFC